MPTDTSSGGQNEPVTATPIRTIRIPDDAWFPAQAATAGRPERVPYVVQLALRAYAADPTATIVALTQIRGGDRG